MSETIDITQKRKQFRSIASLVGGYDDELAADVWNNSPLRHRKYNPLLGSRGGKSHHKLKRNKRRVIRGPNGKKNEFETSELVTAYNEMGYFLHQIDISLELAKKGWKKAGFWGEEEFDKRVKNFGYRLGYGDISSRMICFDTDIYNPYKFSRFGDSAKFPTLSLVAPPEVDDIESIADYLEGATDTICSYSCNPIDLHAGKFGFGR